MMLGTHARPRDMQMWVGRGINTFVMVPRDVDPAEWDRAARSANPTGPRPVTIARHEGAEIRAFPDEPDLRRKQMSVAELDAMSRAWPPARYINFSGDLKQQPEQTYKEMIDLSSWVSGDIYPTNQRRPLSSVYRMVAKLRALAAGHPIGAWIEAADFGIPGGRAPLPSEFRAQIWSAIIGGAHALWFFPLRLAPTFRFDAMPPELVDVLTEQARLLQRLSPDIISVHGRRPDPVLVDVTGTALGHVEAQTVNDCGTWHLVQSLGGAIPQRPGVVWYEVDDPFPTRITYAPHLP